MNLHAAIEDYGAHQACRGDSACHRSEVRRILRALEGELGEPALAEITPDQLRRFLGTIRSRPGLRGQDRVSDHTVFAYYRVLAAFFAYLERQELLVPSPMRRIPRPKVGEDLVRPFSDEQVKKLFAQPDTGRFSGLRDFTLMCFLLDTGCRISEALGLRYADLQLENRLVRVIGKGGREREVPFGSVTGEWLALYLERRRESTSTDYVFVNEYGERLSRTAATGRIAAYGRRAGLRGVRASAHTFRHTFAVRWLLGRDGGYKGDTLSLQRILGHTSPAMTQRYANLVGPDLRRLHDRLSPADSLAEPPQPRRRRLR
jgi:integrase/recombinase XerD